MDLILFTDFLKKRKTTPPTPKLYTRIHERLTGNIVVFCNISELIHLQ